MEMIIEETAKKIRKAVAKAVVGQRETLDLLLVGLFSGGHVLLEDVPGVGKTLLAKALAASIDSSFGRIQCTPDLLPSDVTGTTVYNRKEGNFYFRKGPLFHRLLLVDEINRAIPRTQSALLEAMAEGQVSVDGETRLLDSPFFVIATQNPVESQGTFPLPEAQLDRFLMKVSMGYPNAEEEREIFRLAKNEEVSKEVTPVTEPAEIMAVREAVRKVYMNEAVEGYLLEVVWQTREMDGVELGVSPRGLIALGLAAQALAGIRGRNYVIPDDIKELAPHVLSHRLLLTPSVRMNRQGPADLIRDLVNRVPVPVEGDGESVESR
ncbi:ATPase [Kroppenstedtia guangzhouensis]|uniref:ATPase n=2 Tax=Kroppenstedtia guangzhouensis TaxID=1274356 RepID=A0ABQ1GLM5_9BACL|nr:ATPase [Kroppenstedtia guangzhouensis]